ncbi:hypothetical protein D3C80_1363130 [compost metagenome]
MGYARKRPCASPNHEHCGELERSSVESQIQSSLLKVNSDFYSDLQIFLIVPVLQNFAKREPRLTRFADRPITQHNRVIGECEEWQSYSSH